MGESKKPGSLQMELPLDKTRGGLRVIPGEGKRTYESLGNRDAVVRVLLEAGADMLLRRISPERAEEIETEVDAILGLFDQVDRTPALMPVLQRRLQSLEGMMRESRQVRSSGRRA